MSISGTQILSPRVFKNINHVGLYIDDNQVIEATRQYGVIKRSLNDFLSMADYSIAATVSDTELIEPAITFADSCLDKPYNHSFYPDIAIN